MSIIDGNYMNGRNEIRINGPVESNYGEDTFPYVMMLDPYTPVTKKGHEDASNNGRFKRSPTFYSNPYPYPYSYPSYSYSCYNCYPRRHPLARAVLVGGAAFTG